MQISILYEDKDILVINKPAGLLVHGIYAKGEAKHLGDTLADWLINKYPNIASIGDAPNIRPGLVHRLDKETSGVMVIAKTQEAFLYLKKLFQNKEIKKTYLALVWGTVKENKGVIDKPISIVDGSVKRTVYKGKMKREAITKYEVIKRLPKFTLLKVHPLTGRTHQIRVHLASIGHPVVGDRLYGGKRQMLNVNGQMLDRQFLHADSIEFLSPSGKMIKVGADLPTELQKILDLC